MNAAGTESPTSASQITAGRTKRPYRNGTGRKTTYPTAIATRSARRSARFSEAIATAPTYDAVIRSENAVRTKTSAHQPPISVTPTVAAAGPNPRASDGQKRRR
jgi:hypothetical protein